ncbi:acyl-coenzyme a oxidase peroxisomal-like [Stylonychia lemnae]|uniref:Acyl-coenzyme a oxidase peroxisomal-like n=1 Tax=Stylonychia lemnae TaxID=5949 RepID=A0A078AMR1_STYLE|nr:acyl-coenzyme a oxidase peroxisomal-like [Stylonychia lemnae]|eukprot:CDW82667.1 acyl-coenzyme a oxidase peroxisomal-like [Stylonychia lemnae]
MERASSNLSLLSSHLNPQFQSNQVSKLKPVDDVWESLKMDSYLTPEKVELRKKTRAFMESIEKELHDYINKTEFPFHLVPKIAQLGINGLQMKEFGAPGLTSVETGAILFEMAKVDMSVTTFLMVHNCIGMSVVEFLGDDDQKNRILPDCQALKKVICFGLTEPDYGSDASSLRSSAKKVEGGYLLNGKKRWIGNATFADYIIIWARNEADGNRIQAFVVEKGSKGLKTEKIENKYALRMTQNADITLDNVFVPDNNKLAKAKDFSSANLILEHSRVGVAWTATANAVGAYEASLRYVMQRKQFGKQIAAFQATQLKLSKMLGQCELMLSLCMRLSQLVDQGKTTIGQIGRTKGICSAIGREVCATAREICGGNGILLENRVIKSMLDAEVIYTYEGTYEVNMLVSGREITGGISAFK